MDFFTLKGILRINFSDRMTTPTSGETVPSHVIVERIGQAFVRSNRVREI